MIKSQHDNVSEDSCLMKMLHTEFCWICGLAVSTHANKHGMVKLLNVLKLHSFDHSTKTIKNTV